MKKHIWWVKTLLMPLFRLFIFESMQRETSSLPFGCSDNETNPVFNVLIAYDDFEAGKHAKQTYDFLVENLGEECEFANQMWKFDVLGIPKLREIAARDAHEADIVIISCHAGGKLPEQFKSWMELWLETKPKGIAIVALLDSPFVWTADLQDTRAYLAEAARRGGMEFFCEDDRATHRQRSGEQIMPAAFSELLNSFERDPACSRWGINE